MKKLLLFLPFFLLADVNPFSAGVNSGYGLTPDEKIILQNKKDILSLKNKLKDIEDNLDKVNLKLLNYDTLLQDRLSAFPTLVDEINNAMKDIVYLKKMILQLKKEIRNNKESIKKLEFKLSNVTKDIEILKSTLNSVIEVQNKNYQTLKNMLEEMSKKLNSTMSPKEAFYKGKKYFFNNQLNNAEKLFLFSLSKNYLPATSSYYLGEIYFKKKNYKNALAFYKKSVEFYSKKTSFTPVLLYHSGISFLKLGYKDKAKITFEKLINDFPNSKYANLAKKELEKLK